MAGKLHLSYPPNIAKVTVQRKRLNVFGQGLWHVPFLFLYFFALRACVETSGNPYAEALAHHQAKGYDPAAFAANAAASKQKPPKVTDDWGGGVSVEDDGWGDLAEWLVHYDLFSPKVRWMIQFPRIYRIFAKYKKARAGSAPWSGHEPGIAWMGP